MRWNNVIWRDSALVPCRLFPRLASFADDETRAGGAGAAAPGSDRPRRGSAAIEVRLWSTNLYFGVRGFVRDDIAACRIALSVYIAHCSPAYPAIAEVGAKYAKPGQGAPASPNSATIGTGKPGSERNVDPAEASCGLVTTSPDVQRYRFLAKMSESFAPRLLSRSRLCAYLGDLPWTEVVHWIDVGRLPRPLRGASIVDVNARWDTGEIDRALDDVVDDPGDPGLKRDSDQWAMVRH